MKKNIAIIFGGKSTEHEISILSAMQAIENLNKDRYDIIPIYITKDSKWYFSKRLSNLSSYKNFSTKGLTEVTILPNDTYLYAKKFGRYKKLKNIDCAFIIMHGMNGEDGTIQGLMELANIPYTSCGVLASSVGINKLAQKIYFQGLDIPIIPYISISKSQFESNKRIIDIDKSFFPVVVKPNCLGSSIGISFCKNKTQLKVAIKNAFNFDDIVVIEKAVKKLKEINISAIGDCEDVMLSETEQPLHNHEILTFQDKYLGGNKSGKVGAKITSNLEKVEKNVSKSEKNLNITLKNDKLAKDMSKVCMTANMCKQGTKSVGMQNISRIIPAQIDDCVKELVEKYTKKIFKFLECKGVIRIDFMYDEKLKKLYVNEINTIPGSLAFYLWEYKGLTFETELDKMIDIALKNNERKNLLTTTFEQKVI